MCCSNFNLHLTYYELTHFPNWSTTWDFLTIFHSLIFLHVNKLFIKAILIDLKNQMIIWRIPINIIQIPE